MVTFLVPAHLGSPGKSAVKRVGVGVGKIKNNVKKRKKTT